MVKEEWRDIESWNGRYQVSNKGGKVRRVVRDENSKVIRTQPVSQILNTNGYFYVNLYGDYSEDGRQRHEFVRVHRLVAEAFLPNLYGLPCVNHLDNNQLNNDAENLEWCTDRYNTKFSKAQKRLVRNTLDKYDIHPDDKTLRNIMSWL